VAQGTQVQSAGLLLVMLVVLVVLVVLPAVESAQERHLLVVVMVETKVHRPKQEPPIQEVGVVEDIAQGKEFQGKTVDLALSS
jgi:hypothetical protein